MRLIDFMNAFPDEASCKSKLKEYREKHGVVCPRWDVHSIIGRRTRNATSANIVTTGRVSRLTPYSPGVPSELSERVLLEVQQKELWRSTVRQAYGGCCFIQKSI